MSARSELVDDNYTLEERTYVAENISLELLPLYFHEEMIGDPIIADYAGLDFLTLLENKTKEEVNAAWKRWQYNGRSLKKWTVRECLSVVVDHQLLWNCADRILSSTLEGKIWKNLHMSFPNWVPYLLNYGPNRVNAFLKACPWREQRGLGILHDLAELFESMECEEEGLFEQCDDDLLVEYLKCCVRRRVPRLTPFRSRYDGKLFRSGVVMNMEVMPSAVAQIRDRSTITPAGCESEHVQFLQKWMAKCKSIRVTATKVYCRGQVVNLSTAGSEGISYLDGVMERAINEIPYYPPISYGSLPLVVRDVQPDELEVMCCLRNFEVQDVVPNIVQQLQVQKDKDKATPCDTTLSEDAGLWEVVSAGVQDYALRLQYELLKQAGILGDGFVVQWAQNQWEFVLDKVDNSSVVYFFARLPSNRVRLRYEWGMPSGDIWYPATVCRRTILKRVSRGRFAAAGFDRSWKIFRFFPEVGPISWISAKCMNTGTVVRSKLITSQMGLEGETEVACWVDDKLYVDGQVVDQRDNLTVWCDYPDSVVEMFKLWKSGEPWLWNGEKMVKDLALKDDDSVDLRHYMVHGGKEQVYRQAPYRIDDRLLRNPKDQDWDDWLGRSNRLSMNAELPGDVLPLDESVLYPAGVSTWHRSVENLVEYFRMQSGEGGEVLQDPGDT